MTPLTTPSSGFSLILPRPHRNSSSSSAQPTTSSLPLHAGSMPPHPFASTSSDPAGGPTLRLPSTRSRRARQRRRSRQGWCRRLVGGRPASPSARPGKRPRWDGANHRVEEMTWPMLDEAVVIAKRADGEASRIRMVESGVPAVRPCGAPRSYTFLEAAFYQHPEGSAAANCPPAVEPCRPVPMSLVRPEAQRLGCLLVLLCQKRGVEGLLCHSHTTVISGMAPVAGLVVRHARSMANERIYRTRVQLIFLLQIWAGRSSIHSLVLQFSPPSI